MSSTTPRAGEDATERSSVGTKVRVGSALYSDLVEFLFQEAAFLDDLKFDEWAALLAEDLIYTAPLRSTRSGPDRINSIVRTTNHFEDDYQSIMGRIGRLATKSAWAEDPPSRTRRLVTNILATHAGKPGEFAVRSNILLVRNRYENSDYSLMSGKRNDLIRQVGDGYKLARREIILDQVVLGMANLAVFL
jgi:3-phenylpropionate/cinnamic acid dioxygenase small subunit